MYFEGNFLKRPRFKKFKNYIFVTRKVLCIICYVQILGAIFFGTFWISTNRVELRAGQMSMLSNDGDGCCLLYRYVRSLCSVEHHEENFFNGGFRMISVVLVIIIFLDFVLFILHAFQEKNIEGTYSIELVDQEHFIIPQNLFNFLSFYQIFINIVEFNKM